MLRRWMSAVLVVLSAIAGDRAVNCAENRPMNLLVIQTDEHHFGTLGCYGGKIVGTPHIDSIAAGGALCRRFYAVTPVCSPSRASLVSGMYPQKTPVVTNNIPLDDSIVTFAEILRQRGYATGFAGKWHLDGDGKPQWAPKRKFGFDDNRFMFNRGHWKMLVDTPDGPAVGSRGKNGQPDYGIEGADETTFTTDWLANKTIDFIETNKDRPFCYMVSIPDPHGPNTVRPPYDTMYADVKVPIPATLRRRDEQIPAWGRAAGVTAAQLRRLMPPYYGMVKCIDDNVGRILQTLRKHDLLENTIVVFTSDHGDLCGEHGRLNKGVPYEGSARIPMLVRCPGKINPGTTIDEALTTVDFLPTVLALLEVPLERRVDGRDASSLLTGAINRGDAKDWDDVAFLRSTPGGVWLGAVTGRYKLIYSAAEEPWLIDMQEDPTEVTNLFGQAEQRDRIRALTARLLDYSKTHHDPYARLPNIQQTMAAALAE
ncbi:MAG: sulfatase [Pirellulaceae bacterium]